MPSLKFVEVHNLVAFLSKPTESKGFEEIIDFLNANPIKYALTVNPTSCIKQFWATVKAKTINREGQLQALVDGKKLTLMRFVQVFLNNQLEEMSHHNRIYVTPSHTKKIFGNMKMVGKGFSGRDTPLFPTMMVQAQKEMGEGYVNPTDPHYTPTIIQPSTSQPQNKQKSRKLKRKDTELPQTSVLISIADEAVNEEMDDSLERAATIATSLDANHDRGNISKNQSKATPNEPGSQETSSGVNTPRSDKNSLKLTKLIELRIKLQQRVLDLETTKTTQAMEIESLKRRVKKLEKRKRLRTHGLKRLNKVRLLTRVESYEDEGLARKDASKHERIADIDCI
nr:hypothetical protein [Tanacetum cinerariifolium]